MFSNFMGQRSDLDAFWRPQGMGESMIFFIAPFLKTASIGWMRFPLPSILKGRNTQSSPFLSYFPLPPDPSSSLIAHDILFAQPVKSSVLGFGSCFGGFSPRLFGHIVWGWWWTNTSWRESMDNQTAYFMGRRGRNCSGLSVGSPPKSQIMTWRILTSYDLLVIVILSCPTSSYNLI